MSSKKKIEVTQSELSPSLKLDFNLLEWWARKSFRQKQGNGMIQYKLTK